LTCRHSLTIHEQEAERRSLGPSSAASTGVNDLELANELESVNYEYSSAQAVCEPSRETTSVRRSVAGSSLNSDPNASGGIREGSTNTK